MVVEILGADTTLSPALFADITTQFGDYRWLVRNSTLAFRNDFIIPNPAQPLVQNFNITRPTYDASLRTWFLQATGSPLQLQVQQAAASATSGQVTMFIGMGYTSPNKGVLGTTVSTKGMSALLRSLTTAADGAAALVFEVGTMNVIGVSWLGEPLLDLSQYNISQANPVILIKTLSNLNTNAAVRNAIDFLGGAAVLCSTPLAATAMNAMMPGYAISTRDVLLPGATR